MDFGRKLCDSGYFSFLTSSALHMHREKDEGPGKTAAGLKDIVVE